MFEASHVLAHTCQGAAGDLLIEGARQNNLKNITLRIPHNAVTAITGVSGSGKSSLAFDTLFAEGQWRYVESLSTYARMFLERLDRPDVDRLVNIRPAIAIEQKNPVRTARSTVGTATEIADLLRLLFAKLGRPICPDCREEARGYHPGAVADDLLTRFPQARAMILFPIQDPGPGHDRVLVESLLTRGFVRLKCGNELVDLHAGTLLPRTNRSDLHVVLDRLVFRRENRGRLIEGVETAFREGDGVCRVDVIGHAPQTYSLRYQCQRCGRTFEPIRPVMFSFNHPLGACPDCKGFGNIARRDIHHVSELTIREIVEWLDGLALPEFDAKVAHDILRQLRMKLGFLLRVGLGYLTLSRQTRTLSGGEAQRIALANQLGARLVGTLYVLDEPTIGLHARDTSTLAEILRDLAEAGNTVVVVEHDPQMILAADHVVELGPWSGEKGGEVVCAAPRDAFLADSRALTARYLRGDETVPVPRTRRKGSGNALILAGALEHNLKNLTIRFPLRTLICVTGVSGSGKSTLVQDTLYRAVARAFRVASLPMGRFTAIKGLEHLRGVRLIDQQPIGRTPRSNAMTYLKMFDEVRRIFAATPGAKRRGLSPAHFSFNTTGGRCERCQGNGYEKLEMYFFEDMYVACEECGGRRFGPEVLQVRFRGKTIHDVLGMTVNEAQSFFSGSMRLGETLHLMASIGLGYLRLGQPATTLSGGEAQRLKIAAELRHQRGQAPAYGRSQSPGDMLYILDEPTTGLHLEDIKKLLAVLARLVDAGNTVVVVEHHLDVIKTADWVIDLGPEAGDQGGRLVAEGRPEQVAEVEGSHTGRFLRPLLRSAG